MATLLTWALGTGKCDVNSRTVVCFILIKFLPFSSCLFSLHTTPLHIAAIRNNAQAAKLLLEIPEIDVNPQDDDGVSLYFIGLHCKRQCQLLVLKLWRCYWHTKVLT